MSRKRRARRRNKNVWKLFRGKIGSGNWTYRLQRGMALPMVKPDLILHLAAQSIVRRGYREPFETFSTNVINME